MICLTIAQLAVLWIHKKNTKLNYSGHLLIEVYRRYHMIEKNVNSLYHTIFFKTFIFHIDYAINLLS